MCEYPYSLVIALSVCFVAIISQQSLEHEELYLKWLCGEIEEAGKPCLNITHDPDVPSIKKKHNPQAGDSIFFIESSCSGALTYRQACSVEAAARANPFRDVIVLFIGSVYMDCLNESPMVEILVYPNVFLHRIYLKELGLHNNVSYFIHKTLLLSSRHPVQHLSEILRVIILKLYGGIYMDLDVVVTRSFDHLWERFDWVGRKDSNTIGSALLALNRFGIGGDLSEYLLKSYMEQYDKDSNENLIIAITDMLNNICSKKKIEKMTSVTCQGFEVYPPAYFYPLSFENRSKYFNASFEFISYEPFAYHFWEIFTYDEPIYEFSLYAHIMKNYCPTIYEAIRV